ncbi:MAG: hypothetical protein JNM66_08055 [Bryobacterales bacterium]|nr:hypothetical protein [Bryobacterales bacterium]
MSVWATVARTMMRKQGIDCRMNWKDLQEKRMITAQHSYVSPEEIDAFVEALP